jgi:hypothetical protein
MAEDKRYVKNFYSYVTAMRDLSISRRTLQRWIDDCEITPLEFDDQLKVFLTRKNMIALREYSCILRTRNSEIINRYRQAMKAGNIEMLDRIRKKFL